MVNVDIRVIETVAAFASVVALCVMLKRKGIVTDEHGAVFARLLTQAALPAVVLGPVFASRYRFAGSTASALVMSHILLSMAIIPVSFAVLNR